MDLIYLGFFYSVDAGGGWGKEAEATTAAKSAPPRPPRRSRKAVAALSIDFSSVQATGHGCTIADRGPLGFTGCPRKSRSSMSLLFDQLSCVTAE